MPNSENNNKDNNANSIKTLEDKINMFSSILEKFGLDLITKVGQQTNKLLMLTDKIEELNKATIQIKGFIPQLTNVIENQKYIESELDLIKSLVQKKNSSFSSIRIESEKGIGDETAISKKESIRNQFNSLKTDIEKLNDPDVIIKTLVNIKEDIFEFTGGHRILYEISQVLTKLNEQKPLTSELKNMIKEKIVFWTSKLEIR
ncbi:MAG: hypothetical protein ACTSRI_08720 [Promethearchaeota archaeon]